MFQHNVTGFEKTENYARENLIRIKIAFPFSSLHGSTFWPTGLAGMRGEGLRSPRRPQKLSTVLCPFKPLLKAFRAPPEYTLIIQGSVEFFSTFRGPQSKKSKEALTSHLPLSALCPWYALFHFASRILVFDFLTLSVYIFLVGSFPKLIKSFLLQEARLTEKPSFVSLNK